MKTTITSDTVDFTYQDSIVLVLDKSLFSSLWPIRMLEEYAARLQKRYKEVSNIDKPQSYFEERLTDVMGIIIEAKLEEQFQKESKYIQAFLKYHVRSLRSIRKLIKTDKVAAAHIDNDLYNLQNLSGMELYEILDSIIEKSKKSE